MADNARKDAALREVGRTVVNFQRLEHNLKLAARLRPLHGSVLKVERDLQKQTEKAASMTLGAAIQAWVVAINGDRIIGDYTPDLFDVTVQMTFSIGLNEENLSAHASALDGLLKARNALIHVDLARFEWDSPASCDRLIAELAALNGRIAVQLEFVTAFVRAASEIRWSDVELTQVAGDS